MPLLETRIFVRGDEAQTDWAETLIGRVIRPLTNEFKSDYSADIGMDF
jgi:hypothetical protein